MRGPPGHWMSYGHPCAEHAVWNPKFCVVTDYQMLLLDKEEVLCSQTQRGPFSFFFFFFYTCPYSCYKYEVDSAKYRWKQGLKHFVIRSMKPHLHLFCKYFAIKLHRAALVCLYRHRSCESHPKFS